MTTGIVDNINGTLKHRKSYKPCIVAGIKIANVYNDTLNLGYKNANATKYEPIPHHIACRNGKLVKRAILDI